MHVRRPAQAVLAFLLIAVASFAALSPAPAQAAPEPGVVIGLRTSAENSVNEITTPKAIGAKWVRLFMDWAQSEPAERRLDGGQLQAFDDRVAHYNRQGTKVLISVLRSPQWAAKNGSLNPQAVQPPADPKTYASFIGRMAERYNGSPASKGKVSAWEVWNEPDDPPFWATGPNAGEYTALLKAAYPAVKNADPSATVVIGGLVGNNFEFVDQIYAAGGKGSFDAVGVHTDTACRVDEPGKYYREPNGRIGRFSFTAYREVYQSTVNHGDPKPIWFTEIGWATRTETCTDGAVAGTRPSGVSEALQAQYLKEAFQCMQTDPYVGPVLWFSLQDISANSSSYAHWLGLYRDNGTPKPAVQAFKDVAAGLPNKGCGTPVDVSPPKITLTAGPTYVERLPIKAKATDGETSVRRIRILIDGKEVSGAGSNGPEYDANLLKAREYANGKHTVTARAWDEANNVGETTVTVEKVSLDSQAASAFKVATKIKLGKIKRIRGGRYQVAGSLTWTKRSDIKGPTKPVRIFIEKFDARTKKWKRPFGTAKSARRKWVVAYKPKGKGKWRVRVNYQGALPYLPAKQVIKTFTVR